MAAIDPASFYLGLDGGGTTTRARVVGADGRVLGEGRSGPSNLGLGAEIAERAIGEAVDIAFMHAGLKPESRARTAAGFGFASADIAGLPSIDPSVFGFASTTIVSDAVAACLGAHGRDNGAILILGTGSQGVAIVDGKTTTLGGWGFHLGDQASAAILGRGGIRAAILAHEDMAQASAFTAKVMARFEGSLDHAYVWALTAEPADYAAFARPLIYHAAKDDPVAVAILHEGVAWVELVIGKLVDLGADRVCLMGGLASIYVEYLSTEIREHLVAPRGDAMDGAILLARRSGS